MLWDTCWAWTASPTSGSRRLRVEYSRPRCGNDAFIYLSNLLEALWFGSQRFFWSHGSLAGAYSTLLVG